MSSSSMPNIAEAAGTRAVFILFDCGGSHFIDFDRGIEVHTLMQELEFEWGLQIVPVRFVMIKLDLLIVRVFHIAENGGQVAFGRLIAFWLRIELALRHHQY